MASCASLNQLDELVFMPHALALIGDVVLAHAKHAPSADGRTGKHTYTGILHLLTHSSEARGSKRHIWI